MYMHVAIQMILIVYHAAYTNIVALTVRVYVCYLKHLSTCRLILFFGFFPILVIGTERRDVISCLNLPEYTLLYANTFKANVYSVECHQLRREHRDRLGRSDTAGDGQRRLAPAPELTRAERAALREALDAQ